MDGLGGLGGSRADGSRRHGNGPQAPGRQGGDAPQPAPPGGRGAGCGCRGRWRLTQPTLSFWPGTITSTSLTTDLLFSCSFFQLTPCAAAMEESVSPAFTV
ncbi:hypothetical protein H180DRAFT_01351 [Streptomyces sp. WMMB 322]|nr:hypothetical protein H180DRAFT_01351 [Streptomyces sp. WMMB 322]